MEEINFKDWFWGKFEAWRKGTTKGPTAFARELGIDQQLVSAWLNGKFRPKSQEHIAKIAKKYPDVYEALGFSPSVILNAEGIPPDLVEDAKALLEEIKEAIEREGVELESPRSVEISNEMLDKFISMRKAKA